MDFVIIAKQPWRNEVGHNAKNIALELAREHRVVYFNPPLSRKEQLTGKSEPILFHREMIRKGEFLHQEEPNLWVYYPGFVTESINWIPVNWIFDLLNYQNNRRLAKAVRNVTASLGFRNFVIFNDSEMFQAYLLPDMVEPALSVYYIRDNLISQPYWKRHGSRIEPLLASKYDMVMSNSDYLGDYLRPYNKKTFMIGQGCDLSVFDPSIKRETPDDMKGISNPVIGYTGFLTSLRLDLPLLESAAASEPDYSFVLVGPEDKDFASSRLHQMKNVYFLGNKKPEELPAYIQHFDVCINPQVVNPMTIGNYPRKIDEYLAMGKPTVAKSTRAMDYFGEHVYLYESGEQFLNLLGKAIAEDSKDLACQRIDFASGHTWKANAEQIIALVEQELEPQTQFS